MNRARVQEALGVTLTHGDGFDLPNGARLFKDRFENKHNFSFCFWFGYFADTIKPPLAFLIDSAKDMAEAIVLALSTSLPDKRMSNHSVKFGFLLIVIIVIQ